MRLTIIGILTFIIFVMACTFKNEMKENNLHTGANSIQANHPAEQLHFRQHLFLIDFLSGIQHSFIIPLRTID